MTFSTSESAGTASVPWHFLDTAVGGTWSAGSPAKVLEGPYVTISSNRVRSYDVSTDGRRFLMIEQPTNQAAASQIIVVQNWFEELKRLVPVN